jgi:hypothetical protein
MKLSRIPLVSVILLTLSPAALAAQPTGHRPEGNGNFGLGLILGEPTGISGKYWIRNDRAIDGEISFSFNSFFIIQSDYLFHFHGLFGTRESFTQHLEPYIGIGGSLFFSTTSNRTNPTYFTNNGGSVGFGVRIPFGAEWMIPSAPFGIFLELAPGIGLIPGTFGFLQGGIGARFYF